MISYTPSSPALLGMGGAGRARGSLSYDSVPSSKSVAGAETGWGRGASGGVSDLRGLQSCLKGGWAAAGGNC